jgi:hypothetical protein
MHWRIGRLTGPTALILAVMLVVAPMTVMAGKPKPHAASDMSGGDVPGYRYPITSPGVPMHSVARIWNETLLDAIRKDRPKPPVHARNLFHLSVAMWDAWATYDPVADGFVTTEKNTAPDVLAARNEAISYAAYRLLLHRFPGIGYTPAGDPCQPGALVSQAVFEQTMLDLGFDPSITTTVGDTPAAVGNRIGQAVIDYGLADGAAEGFDLCYPDPSGYTSFNDELIIYLFGTNQSVNDPNHWQKLAFEFQVSQNDIPEASKVQAFVGVAWGGVKGFAVTDADIPPLPPVVPCVLYPGAPQPHFDPGCPPQLGGVGDETVVDAMVEVIRLNSYATPDETTILDHSPSVYGNNPLGSDAGTGHGINPFTGLPYDPNPMTLGDFTRVNAEFWADGPNSETPPGHWNTLANYVTDHPGLGEKRLFGTGPLLDDLEWDVKLYLALNGATHDAAIGAWGTKNYYDSSRPITLIRYMAEQGQRTDPGLPHYSPIGLPLEDGLIELITDASVAPGGKFEHLKAFCDAGNEVQDKPCDTDADCIDDLGTPGTCLSSVDKIAIRGWLGSPADPDNEVGGVDWILAEGWLPYQLKTFVTPPFPGYTSGHSTYSRSAAEVLTCFTGSEYFPGGLGEFVALQNAYLSFELGPTETVHLQWASYFDAADEAGTSRRYGGIHPFYDDYPARVMGSKIGKAACAKALEYFNQEIPPGDDDETGDGDDETGDGGDDETGDGGDDETGDDEGDDNGFPGKGKGKGKKNYRGQSARSAGSLND